MPRTIVILHPGGLGDLLLAVPAIESLRTQFPAHEILLCGHDEGSKFLAECGVVDRSLSIHATACTALFGGTTSDDPLLADWLDRCDWAVAWTNDASGALAIALKRSGVVVPLIQSPFAAALTGVHQGERYAEILGLPPGQLPIAHVALPEALKKEAQEYLGDQGFASDRPLALVHPGSGSRHKCVSPEILIPVLEGMEAQGLEPLILEGPADEEMVERVLIHTARSLAVLRGLSVRLLAGVLSHVEMFLGHDSGVTHLAAMFGRPTVALFGPTDPARWAPRGRAVTVITGKPCICPSWESVQRCQEKPCLQLSSPTILEACLAIPRAR
jgi:ADP-heptose:LPS heptosyltransferase